jgi:hypothetical protein
MTRMEDFWVSKFVFPAQMYNCCTIEVINLKKPSALQCRAFHKGTHLISFKMAFPIEHISEKWKIIPISNF